MLQLIVRALRRLGSAHALALCAVMACNGPSTGLEGGGVRERWYQAQAGYGLARPAVLRNTVVFGTGDGQIIARDVGTGTVRWSARVGSQQVMGFNLVARNGVVVAPVSFYTVGLDAQTGRELWRYEAPKDTAARPPGTVANSGSVGATRIDADDATVYVPAWGASISAVDLRTGVPRWIWQPGRMEGDTAVSGIFRSGSMGARVSGDTVFATVWHYVTRLGGTSEAWVVALDRITGRELWRVRLPFQGSGVVIEAPPSIYRNLVIVHTLYARTFAIDRSTLEIAWDFRSPTARSSTISASELYGDAVYIDGGDGSIYALRASDGSQIWRSPFPTQTNRDLLVTDRRVIFSNALDLFVIDRLTGTRVASTRQPRTNDSFFGSAAAFADGVVFVTVGDGAWAFEEP